MLCNLSINNIVLIDRLQIDFEDGLCVLSGETGAGKSILLDSMGLAMGARGEKGLVRHGTDQGVVSAEFALPKKHALWTILDHQGIEHDNSSLILRRILTSEGRSRAFINDQLVSIGLLREVGDRLVEIHGQHDERGLLNAVGHRKILDDYGQYPALKDDVKKCFEALCALKDALAIEQEKLELVRADEDYIRHNMDELEKLSPEENEEDTLADSRARMMQGERLSGDLGDILKELLHNSGVDASLRGIIRRLVRLAEGSRGLLEPAIEGLDRAASEASDAIVALEEILHTLDFNPHDLENTEERLFALRAAARKHKCSVAELPLIKQEFEQKLHALEFGDEEVRRLQTEVITAQAHFKKAALALSSARKETAHQLDKLVGAELLPLKMEKARFQTKMTDLEEENWGLDGAERVEFEISTNPGSPFGGLIKIASGGELSRFILALKVVLARKSTVPTLVFDEIDRGVGGAVADAVGERLERLSREAQILVITHSPQVAARGANHWLIEKKDHKQSGATLTNIISLDTSNRQEEIARMLAGAKVTDEARAAAASLMDA